MLKVKNLVFLTTYIVIIVFALLNVPYIWDIIKKFIMILMPFIYGIIIAYIINWPYKFFRKNLFKTKIKNDEKLVNMISISISYVLVFGVFIFLIVTILPEIVINLKQLIDNFSKYSDSFLIWTKNIENKSKIGLITDNYTDALVKNLTLWANKFVEKLFPSVFNFTKSFAISIYNLIIGIIISFYLIGSKEKLIKQFNMISKAYFPSKFIKNISKIFYLTHETFGKFLVGKIIDSIIVGILCFIGTSILQIPYTLLISAIVTMTNIIPFFGPFIGAIPCILLLLIIDPVKALWFTIFILILQQIDGNIIGPKVLGNTVGISGLWIMFSVIIGGGIFGIPGMIIGVPVFAVIYTILAEKTKNNLMKASETSVSSKKHNK